MLVTAACVDPRLDHAVVDIDEWRDTPARHRYINGHFESTDSRFSFYFPPAEEYEGRFFQATHQLVTSENAPPRAVAFGIASGAYVVQTNNGGNEALRSVAAATSANVDPSIMGYRVNAAAAKFSKTIATEMYGEHRTYGYLYGGSGGAFQTIAGLENTVGVWDGAVPYVMGTPHAIPNVFTVRINALRVLRIRDKLPGVMDAIDPGGSGDPYATLNAEERAALEEAARMGFPPRGWWNHATMNGGPLALVAGYVPVLDPAYAEDFWTEPGYLGSDAASSIQDARIMHDADVVNVVTGAATRIDLSSTPPGDSTGADLIVTSGAAAGQRVGVGAINDNTVSLGFGTDPQALNGLEASDTVRVDNSLYLALQTYHRHQLPSPDFYGWDQFRDADGDPIYPQRDILIGPVSAFNGAGSIPTGRFDGKMIVVQSLMDIDALPWQADWYRTKVQEASGDRFDDNFRLYYIDHAQHGAPVGAAAMARTVSYQGALEQAIRNLSAWVEDGLAAPAATQYAVDDSQIVVPASATDRRGIQPVVRLRVDDGERADIAVGETVSFTASIEMPPGTGEIVSAEWDFLGAGTYPAKAEIPGANSEATLTSTYTYTEPGTYFPVLRAASERDGDVETPFARVENLDRVRVVVR